MSVRFDEYCRARERAAAAVDLPPYRTIAVDLQLDAVTLSGTFGGVRHKTHLIVGGGFAGNAGHSVGAITAQAHDLALRDTGKILQSLLSLGGDDRRTAIQIVNDVERGP